MEHTTTGRVEATTRWKAARTRLSEAIQEFSEATSIFTRALFSPASSGEVEFDIESILESLDLEIQRLASEDKILGAAHTRLKVARNASKRVVPISRLPFSVLSHIFGIVGAWADDCCDRNGVSDETAQGDYTRWKPRRSIALTGVCTAWRQIIVETPSFWSHIDIRFVARASNWTYLHGDYSMLCLQRANNAPLKLHILLIDRESDEESLASSFPEYLRGRTLSSITFELYYVLNETANPLLRVWMDIILANPVTCLKIKSPLGFDVEELPVTHMREQLHTVELAHIRTDWNQIRFPGLVNLTLNGHSTIPMNQLRDILVASPALSSLVISGTNADENDLLEFEGVPIELGRLVSLGLGDASAFDVILLLRMIIPAPECTALSISCTRYVNPNPLKNPDENSRNYMWEIIQTFCIQHNVSHLSLSLDIVSHSTRLWLSHLLCSLTNLHTLALWHVDLYIYDFEISDFGESTDHFFQHMTPPGLQRLYLVKVRIPGLGLQHMVSTSSITWLRMDHCIIKDPPQDHCGWLERSVPELHLHGVEDGTSNAECFLDCELPWWMEQGSR